MLGLTRIETEGAQVRPLAMTWRKRIMKGNDMRWRIRQSSSIGRIDEEKRKEGKGRGEKEKETRRIERKWNG